MVFQFSLWDSASNYTSGPLSGVSFQFSLWDSLFSTKVSDTSYLDFQFSLWDSKMWIWKKEYVREHLSILFMRFKNEVKLEWEGKYNFQFSLWDSSHNWRRMCTKLCSLSILFMRFGGKSFYDTFPDMELSILFMRFTIIERKIAFFIASAFNSLYEIQYYDELVKRGYEPNFQFSLWDSDEIKIRGHVQFINGFQFSLWDSVNGKKVSSNFYSAPFNSLYEIPFRLTPDHPVLVCLSILFMRFWEVQELRRILLIFFQFSLWDSNQRGGVNETQNKSLSILFMRFLRLNLQLNTVQYDFQFSLWDSNFRIWV